MEADDEKWMRVALECAARGRGRVEPNPMVGAVLVRDGREIARGWHERFGGPHAEIEALEGARAAGDDARGATLYVTLEPCSVHGKTPPCTDALIAAAPARVVAAMEDPDPNARGRGFERLRRAGIEVAVGVRQREARELLAAYCKLRTLRRPWVICKWAQTAEGLLALDPAAGGDRWISGAESRQRVHQLRGLCQGILVGVGTVLADDPLLTNRGPAGGQPARVVLDGRLRIPADCRLVRSVDVSPVLVATTPAAAGDRADKADQLRAAGVELLELPAADEGVDVSALLDELGRRQWTYLLVEGGTKVLASFVLGRLADELIVFVSGLAGDAAGSGRGEGLPRFHVDELPEPCRGTLVEEKPSGPDVMLRYRVRP